MIKIDGVAIDIATSESYSFDSDSTSIPVEQGSEESDHVRLPPLEITIECVVSNSPTGRVASDPSRVGADGKASDAVFQRMLAIRDARRPVTYEGRRGRFENMVLSFEVNDDIETAEGLRFTAKLKQVQLVENRRVAIKRIASVPRGQPKINKGAVAADQRTAALRNSSRWLVTTIAPGQTTNDRLGGLTGPDLVQRGCTPLLKDQYGWHYRVDGVQDLQVTQGVTANGPLNVADGWVEQAPDGKRRYQPFTTDPRTAWSNDRSPGETAYREYQADPKNYWKKILDNAGVPSDAGGLPVETVR